MTMKEWIQKHPGRAALRALWVVVNFAFGAASGGFLAWGPLGAGWAAMVGLGLLGGLVAGGVWARQQVAAALGQTDVARGWRRRLLLATAAIFIGIGAPAAVQFYRLGAFPPVGQDYVTNFDHLSRAMDRYYAYFELKEVDWASLTAAYRPRVLEAETDEDYYDVVAEMLVELDDAHTGLVEPYPPGGVFAFTEKIEGEAVVTWSSLAGEAVGLTRGAIVQSVGGMTVDERIAYLEELDPRIVSGSTPRQREARGYLNLLRIPADEPVEVSFEAPDGEQRTATLSWDDAPENPYANLERTVTGERLASGVGVIRIPTFDRGAEGDPVADFDAALDGMMDAPGLIIDLRGNGGGASFVAEPIAGRLVTETVVYAHERYRARLPRFGWRIERTATVRPRGETYTGPVVILIDTLNMSTSETFALSLADTGRAQTVGRTTAGATGNPTPFRLVGGGRARYSLGALTRLDGTPLEGNGVFPDVAVEWTIEDVRQGRDPDIETAEGLILER